MIKLTKEICQLSGTETKVHVSFGINTKLILHLSLFCQDPIYTEAAKGTKLLEFQDSTEDHQVVMLLVAAWII